MTDVQTGARTLSPATDPPARPADASPDPAFERFARLVAVTLDVPVALVSMSTGDGCLTFPGAVGSGPWEHTASMPTTDTLCQHVIGTAEPLVVADAREQPDLRDLPAARDADVVAYAGYPVRDTEGRTVGSLCAIDHEPRDWTERDLQALADLADACSVQVRLQEETRRARTAEEDANRRHRHASIQLALAEALSATTTVDDVLDTAQQLAAEKIGAARSGIALTDGRGRLLEWVRAADVPDMPRSMWSADDLHTDDQWPSVQCVRRREALYFADADELTASFPRMDGLGGPGALVLLPLVTRDAVIGVLMLRWLEPRPFDAVIRALLTTMAGYTALALERARLLQHRHDVAHVLQTAMLTELPDPAGLALDGAYIPAVTGDQVGGDWYDALILKCGGTAVLIGDVTGHDIDAAALMGQLRLLLRGSLWSDEAQSPAGTLQLVDEANIGTGIEATASVLLAYVEPPGEDGFRKVRWSSAGHPPAFVRRADGRVERLIGVHGLILGVAPDLPRRNHETRLGPGDTLVLYTDGLVERRGERLQVGLDRLAERLADLDHVTPRALVDAMSVGDLHEDDVAVLTVHVEGL
ncbi:SpoIIE family protein phosphatase [Luteimicrobium subarcticum]|uniref:Serine phosphatase RsbU (Regulator of sigma subunit) n=1 Tax=Luteimicrobium subarcticum TaxID=620910 RepID=A0A2M8W1M9_9MICO|nr:SpoIIE family protein phosphatase [Luteimicrobium subarcticum]PJI84842.1 serine phosphatase RsbU (regulator of sigma subunit) [Luteimicrobium subarcticum]